MAPSSATVELGMGRVSIRFTSIVVALALALSGQCKAADEEPALSWRGVNIGMTRAEASARLLDLGFVPQPVQWGGRGRESWEGIMSAPPRTGACTGDAGEQCEQASLSIVRDTAGQEIVWVITAWSHLSAPAYVERLLAPAFDRYGNRYVVDWRNGYKMRNGTVQFRLWNGYWYPNGSQDSGQIQISTSVFPRQTINPTDPVPPVPDRDARAWGVTVIVSDWRIRDRTEQDYEDRDHSLPPPVRY